MGLLRERAKAVLLGAATAGGAYVSTKRLIWRSTAELVDCMPGAPAPAPPPEEPERLLGAYARACMVRSWNQVVDSTFSMLIEGVLTQEAPTEPLCE